MILFLNQSRVFTRLPVHICRYAMVSIHDDPCHVVFPNVRHYTIVYIHDYPCHVFLSYPKTIVHNHNKSKPNTILGPF